MAAKARRAPLGVRTKQGYVGAPFDAPDVPDYVMVELRYESPVAFTPSGFSAPAAAEPQAAGLNEVLSRYDVKALRSHFGMKSPQIRRRVEVAAMLPAAPKPARFAGRGMDAEFIHSGFVQVVPRHARDVKKLAADLNRRQAVWKAQPAPRPVPAVAAGAAAGSRNFEPAQAYLSATPNGMGVAQAWALPGARGKGITVCDIEGNWNRGHQDLPAGIALIGGTVIAEAGWRDHGTAVLGQLVAQPGAGGVVGICHEATAMVQGAVVNGVFNTAGAINNAASRLRAGDVLLIELQAVGPNGKYVAMQYWPDVFSAIVAATARGITVVEAAGNGDENFDLAAFKDTGLQKDSGAVLVGAGVPAANHYDYDQGYATLGPQRSRIWFSNYGRIVNLHAWGWNVATLGYGDAQGGASENGWYTLRFSGTSSASPMVAGAVACLQGHAVAKRGAPLTPSRVRSILASTGVTQLQGPGVPVSQKIGPMPNLPRALAKV